MVLPLFCKHSLTATMQHSLRMPIPLVAQGYGARSCRWQKAKSLPREAFSHLCSRKADREQQRQGPLRVGLPTG
jgi:hypothetical protein